MTGAEAIVNHLRRSFESGVTRNVQWRRENLRNILTAFNERIKDISETVNSDFGKCSYEMLLTEIGVTKGEANYALNNLSSWMKPQSAKMDFFNSQNTGYIRAEPKGVVLVIGCWNYPFSLAFVPIINAIAAGNCVLLKPSEMSPKCSKEMVTIINQYLDTECIKVIEGGADVIVDVLKQQFDHIIFTGSVGKGKLVMKAAAEFLTPVTLELGGKCPAYIDVPLSRIAVTARRLVWGRFVNAGQSCISPDYILVRSEIHAALLRELKLAITEYYGENPLQSKDLASLVDDRNFNRVFKLMEADKARVVFGGASDAEARKIEPTILDGVEESDASMQDEVFGPLMLIRAVRDAAEACEIMNRVDNRPLAMYVFTEDKNVKEECLSKVTSGGVCVNDTMIHASVTTLPFGGVGKSGMGSYHGYDGFKTFSHMRSCLEVPFWTEFLGAAVRYGPYTAENERDVTQLMRREQSWSWIPEPFRGLFLTISALPIVRRR